MLPRLYNLGSNRTEPQYKTKQTAVPLIITYMAFQIMQCGLSNVLKLPQQPDENSRGKFLRKQADNMTNSYK